MNFIYIDSCSEKLFVMAYNQGKYAVRQSEGNKKHNSVLLPCLDEVLQEVGLNIKEVENIACVVGPGSFTGIRLGVTTCNGLSFATGANRIAVNTFESFAYNNTNHILVALDARHDNFYVGEYNNGKEIMLGNLTLQEVNAFDGEVIFVSNDKNYENIIQMILTKIASKDFVQSFVPLYLKKSQAERELKC